MASRVAGSSSGGSPATTDRRNRPRSAAVHRVAPDPATVGTQGAAPANSRWPVGARAWASAVVTASEPVMAHGPSTWRSMASA
jgi:hypothetical protein